MSTAARKARKRAGIPFEKAPKVGTPVLERSHTWMSRFNPTKRRTEIRPSRTALDRGYGIRDLGWQPVGSYLTRRGELRKGARA